MSAVGEELSLTRSAVSHGIRRLEAELGFALVEPDGRGVRLTQRGRRYAAASRQALSILAAAATETPPLSGELRLACPPGLATMWLSERIGGFAALHPEIKLTIAAARRLGGMADDDADVEIGFGDRTEMAEDAELLAKVSLFPVCAPSLLNGDPPLNRVSDLAQFTLLHLGTNVDWARWLEAAGAGGPDARSGVVFSDMPMVQAAAVAGQGVALGDSITAHSALETGQLFRPFKMPIPCRWSYFIRRRVGPNAAALSDWLKTALAETRRA